MVNCSKGFRLGMLAIPWVRSCFTRTDGSARRFRSFSPSFENCGACDRHSNGSVITTWSYRCIGFGGSSVDRCVAQELLKAIAPLGLEASLRALEELSAGGTAQRAALSRKLEQLVYEAKKAFEQYDAVDARNRLAAGP